MNRKCSFTLLGTKKTSLLGHPPAKPQPALLYVIYYSDVSSKTNFACLSIRLCSSVCLSCSDGYLLIHSYPNMSFKKNQVLKYSPYEIFCSVFSTTLNS